MLLASCAGIGRHSGPLLVSLDLNGPCGQRYIPAKHQAYWLSQAAHDEAQVPDACSLHLAHA